ncbi:MAG: hypothetical protein EPO32_14720 [Anaerolineae bacterium]|nr:MAG: hypothetical protein EPO32_14720 [Anaerolineae bacterium]
MSNYYRVAATVQLFHDRLSVIHYLDGCVKFYDIDGFSPEAISQRAADWILAEWDATHTPEQLPKPMPTTLVALSRVQIRKRLQAAQLDGKRVRMRRYFCETDEQLAARRGRERRERATHASFRRAATP